MSALKRPKHKTGMTMDKTKFTNAGEANQNMVYRAALNCLGSAADAEDSVQELFLRL